MCFDGDFLKFKAIQDNNGKIVGEVYMIIPPDDDDEQYPRHPERSSGDFQLLETNQNLVMKV